MIKYIPNILSCLRILGSLLLIFTEPLSTPFFVIYIISGVSDALDGTIARGFHVTSDLGTRLDSIADLLFYAVMLIKLFPELFAILPWQIWIIVAVIVAVRIASYAVAALKYRKFASLHTYFNKLCGLSMFLVPFFVTTDFGVAYCITVCTISAICSVEELFVHIFSKQYDGNQKTIIKKAK